LHFLDGLPLNLGYLAAIAAYVLWGLFPFYWKYLQHVDAIEVIGHRIVWSFLALLVGLGFTWKSTVKGFERFHRDKRNYLWSLLAALLIATNWLVFIWSVQHKMVVESALGYFITPLMSVALGVILLGERLRLVQWIAVGCAALGVGYIALMIGQVPYLAIILASSFAVYGIVKKRMPLGALPGLWLETAMLLFPAMALLFSYTMKGQGSFGTIDRTTDFFILGAGPTTAIPLLLFAYGAQRIPLSQLGLLQYIAPSIQFVVGWLAFHEEISLDRWIGFSLVWIGLLIFAATSIRRRPALPLEDL
jgi:chloramphenicol-sensitive protein RarD